MRIRSDNNEGGKRRRDAFFYLFPHFFLHSHCLTTSLDNGALLISVLSRLRSSPSLSPLPFLSLLVSSLCLSPLSLSFLYLFIYLLHSTSSL